MSITLKNKKIIISAGGSGIGWSSAKIFLDKGATVYLCDINANFGNRIYARNVGSGNIAGTVEAGDDPPPKKKPWNKGKKYMKGSRKMWLA